MSKKFFSVVVALLIISLLIVVYIFFPNIFSFFSRNKVAETSTNRVTVVKYSITPKEIKSTENATIEISLESNKRSHEVQVIFYTNSLVKIYLPDWKPLNATKADGVSKFLYSFYLDPAFQEVSLNFMLKGDLSNLVNSAEYTVVLELLVDGSPINRTWSNATITIKK
ncbi:MAG: hypothetical protein ACP5KW_09475 [Thermoproteota archaeon]